MGKQAGYWVNRIRPSFKARSRSKLEDNGSSGSGSGKDDVKPENTENHQKEENLKKEESKNGTTENNGKRVMVVVDTSLQAKNALRWALIHCVQDEDNIVLLYVVRPPKVQALGGETQRERTTRAYEQVHHLKNFCQLKKPKVKTEIEVVEAGEEKGRTIVEESKKQRAGVLVFGQRKRQSRWRVIWTWSTRRRTGNSVVEYCIHNADCMAIAVRKKSNNGGYLITTKRHKDFWLLA